MKSAALVIGCAGFGFVLLGFQLGIFSEAPPRTKAEETPEVKVEKKPAAPFPDSLAPACKGQSVPEAAEVDVTKRASTYRFAFLKVAGGLHSWHSYLKEEWQAETVEETQLVVVLGPQRKSLLSVHHYPNGAPSVSRYKFEMEASIVVPKSGRVLVHKRFVSMPRALNQVEAWELTHIEQPVTFATVFNWASSQAQAGFVQEVGVVTD